MFLANHPHVERELHEKCSCTGSCSGYGTRENCPPLIVVAVLALAHPGVAVSVCAAQGAG